MSKLASQLEASLQLLLRAGDLPACDQSIAEALRTLPSSPFHIALDLHFTNSPQEVAAHFDAFFRRESERYEIAAAYTETNGFEINPKRWYCDLFAFEAYGGTEDFDWLSDWCSEPWPELTLTGMEALQAVYASPAAADRTLYDASALADLLVVTRFQSLIAAATAHMKAWSFPLLATTHGRDYIAEFHPQT